MDLGFIDFIDDIDREDLDFMDNFRDSQVNRTRIDPFETFDDLRFKRKTRFSKVYVNRIYDVIKEDFPYDVRGQTIDPRTQVVCALRCWARHQIQDDSGDLHGISQPAVSKICKRVSEALAKMAPSFICMPSSVEEQTEVIRNFRQISNFPTVVGAIDYTHIRIKRVSGDLSEAYVNRKGYYSLNVQVVCDSSLRIRDIVARWRGSVHDSRIFNESAIKERFENSEFHGRLLGDSGYACTPYLFTPLLHPNNEKEEAYNKAHISTRNTIERCFGLWKQRFRCLLRGMYMKLSTAKTSIVALAVLHNIAIDMNEHIDIVRYVRQRQRQRLHPRDTTRGAIIRNNFINQHF
ncbi:putative nuclease HARBI1 [Colias croceus]|uniref:putative nuclease HARBI1 n=1 Tax=Colias crocea TaxID=72248 RepID=UPI001E27CD47|nr:putative nuclease HARBI1 [Colias croceus]